MDLLLVRHALAEDAARPGRPADARRKLTAEGRRRMKAGARGLRELVPGAALVATSPLVRAVESAEILAELWSAKVERVEALAPGALPGPLLAWLGKRRRGPIVLVGHEPSLSALAALLLSRRRTPLFTLKKGGACLLEVTALRPGGARLAWLAPARTLRLLGEQHHDGRRAHGD